MGEGEVGVAKWNLASKCVPKCNLGTRGRREAGMFSLGGGSLGLGGVA
jgi:hypothetical protein